MGMFYENFSNNDNNWSIRDDRDIYLNIENDVYVFEHRRSQGWYSVWNHIPIQKDEFGIICNFRKVLGNETSFYGLIWGLLDINHFYCFAISGNGYFRISKIENGLWTHYQNWHRSECINTSNSQNQLLLGCTGSSYRFGINDTLVVEGNWPKPFFGESIGFIVGDTMKVYIDNLQITSPSIGYQPQVNVEKRYYKDEFEIEPPDDILYGEMDDPHWWEMEQERRRAEHPEEYLRGYHRDDPDLYAFYGPHPEDD